jgi:hypothetical protein
MKTPEKKPITFSLFSIKDEEFYVKEVSEEIKENFNTDLLKTAFGWSIEVDLDAKIFSLKLGIMYHYSFREKETEILKYFASFSFKVQNLSDVVKIYKKQDNIEVRDDLFASTFGVAYSTMRGCIFQKTKNNFINQFYLPVINPHSFLKENIPGFGETEDVK